LKELSLDDFSIQLDLPQFFDYYKIINASALGSRIGMDKTLLSQYVNGHKKPSHKQVEKIMNGIKQLGNELASLELSF
jgi:transcriptional regulator with XRE-family HTH domain